MHVFPEPVAHAQKRSQLFTIVGFGWFSILSWCCCIGIRHPSFTLCPKKLNSRARNLHFSGAHVIPCRRSRSKTSLKCWMCSLSSFEYTMISSIYTRTNFRMYPTNTCCVINRWKTAGAFFSPKWSTLNWYRAPSGVPKAVRSLEPASSGICQ